MRLKFISKMTSADIARYFMWLIRFYTNIVKEPASYIANLEIIVQSQKRHEHGLVVKNKNYPSNTPGNSEWWQK